MYNIQHGSYEKKILKKNIITRFSLLIKISTMSDLQSLGHERNYTENSGETFFVIRQILTNFAKVKQKIVSIFSDPGDIAIDCI